MSKPMNEQDSEDTIPLLIAALQQKGLTREEIDELLATVVNTMEARDIETVDLIPTDLIPPQELDPQTEQILPADSVQVKPTGNTKVGLLIQHNGARGATPIKCFIVDKQNGHEIETLIPGAQMTIDLDEQNEMRWCSFSIQRSNEQ